MNSSDSVVLARARELCDRGSTRTCADQITRPRLRKIISEEDAFEARFMVPILVEMIERLGLGSAMHRDTDDDANPFTTGRGGGE